MTRPAVDDRRTTITDNTRYGEQFADFYDSLFPSSSFGDDEVRWVMSVCDGDPRILELGVGTGRVAIPVAAELRRRAGRDAAYVGVDLSPEMVTALRDKDSDDVVDGRVGDIRTFSDPSVFGTVLCVCATLSMVGGPDDQQQVMDTCARHLRVNGRVIVETHNPPAVRALTGGLAQGSYYVRYRHHARPDVETGMVTFFEFDGPTWTLDHVWISGDEVVRASEVSRLTEVHQIDEFAQRAGLRLVSRHSDLAGSEFHIDTSPLSVSVYEKSDRP